MLVRHEMRWTLAWFEKQESEWQRRALFSGAEHLPGHKCYAEKQMIMWKKMRDRAAENWDFALNLKQ